MIFNCFHGKTCNGCEVTKCPHRKEKPVTNFERITESPEKLAEWIFNDRVEQSEWWYPQCGHTVGEVFDWLKEESEMREVSHDQKETEKETEKATQETEVVSRPLGQ